MTLAPTTTVRGVEGKRAERNPICSVPGCISRSQHGHHIWPRSYLRGQPQEWVQLPGGRVVSNVTGLCATHHAMVTGGIGGHQARIEYVAGTFMWYDLRPDSVSSEPLHPQPVGDGAKLVQADVPHPTQHAHLAEGETCQSCGYTKPVRRQPGPKRKTRTWAMDVPADSEDGAEILDGLVDDFAAVLGMDTTGGRRLLRYHVTVAVLLWAAQQMPDLIRDVREASDDAASIPAGDPGVLSGPADV